MTFTPHSGMVVIKRNLASTLLSLSFRRHSSAYRRRAFSSAYRPNLSTNFNWFKYQYY